jgi:hypothetical protein
MNKYIVYQLLIDIVEKLLFILVVALELLGLLSNINSIYFTIYVNIL